MPGKTSRRIVRIDEHDNLWIALTDLEKGEELHWEGQGVLLHTKVPAKHQFTCEDVPLGGIVRLYGVPVGKATVPIKKGSALTTDNVRHYAAKVHEDDTSVYHWQPPDVSRWQNRTFKGIVRPDGRVATANYWLIVPLVFCQNRNAARLKDVLERALGYAPDHLGKFTRELLTMGVVRGAEPVFPQGAPCGVACEEKVVRPFPFVDGVRVLNHHSGCGGSAQDAQRLCEVLAAYVDHPNVAGATVFSLGCEKAQLSIFEATLQARNPQFNKPLLKYRQQDWLSEELMMREAVRHCLEHMPLVNEARRSPVPLSKLKIGVKCGGSDGFSGISANTVIGDVSDKVVTLGGTSALAEFPELCGAEGNIILRCATVPLKQRFVELMRRYEREANACNVSMADNPSPGNIRDGLITDAIKSAGAARKAGKAPFTAVCDYAEALPESGLGLVCTPGNDVEACSGLVAAGVNVVLFSTGLGTPTGNAIAPVIKISSNSTIASSLAYMIDFDCGPVISGAPISEMGDQLLETVLRVAGREVITKAEQLGQQDFLFWKRDVSL